MPQRPGAGPAAGMVAGAGGTVEPGWCVKCYCDPPAKCIMDKHSAAVSVDWMHISIPGQMTGFAKQTGLENSVVMHRNESRVRRCTASFHASRCSTSEPMSPSFAFVRCTGKRVFGVPLCAVDVADRCTDRCQSRKRKMSVFPRPKRRRRTWPSPRSR